MENKYTKAFKEVSVILDIAEQEELNKIPKEIIDFIKENMDKEYEPNINFEEAFEESVLEETLVILALLYRDYLIDENERRILIEKEQIELEKAREQYSIENLFGTKNKTKEISQNEKEIDTSLIKIKDEKWYEKIIKKIKRILKIGEKG